MALAVNRAMLAATFSGRYRSAAPGSVVAAITETTTIKRSTRSRARAAHAAGVGEAAGCDRGELGASDIARES